MSGSIRSPILKSLLKGREYVDAKKPCTINITEADLKYAAPDNGRTCVAARCAKRAFDAKEVYFYKSVAYIEFSDKLPIERFIASYSLQKCVIQPLDAGRFDEIQTGRYDLLPPRGSLTLENARKRNAHRKVHIRKEGSRRANYTIRSAGRIRTAGRLARAAKSKAK